MKKDLAIKLKEYSNTISQRYSNPDREFNFSNETFAVDEIMPTSETTATVTFQKSSGKRAVYFFYWINMNGGQWQYFVPTYDHCAGMKRVIETLHEIEMTNFGLNFKND